MSLGHVLPVLACPVCRGGLAGGGAQVSCAAGHAFDVARQGYVTLTAGPIRHPGDTAAMVMARERVQGAGVLAAVTHGLVAAVPAVAGVVLDVGAGTGHHLAAVLDTRPGAVGVALDSSTPAVRRAARAHARAGAVRADLAAPLPMADEVVDTALVVFAPRPGAELDRVLTPDGVVVTVTPRPGHLHEVADPLGMVGVDPAKADRLAGSLPAFEPAATADVDARATVDRPTAADLALMGPTGHHVDAGELAARATALPDPVEVTVAVRVTTWRRAGT